MRLKVGILVVCAFFLALPAAFGADDLDKFVGTWGGQETKAVYRISRAGSGLHIQAVDTTDGEEFVIKDVQVLHGELFFTSVMPSTNWTVHHHVLVLGENELQVTRSGDSKKESKLFRQ